MAEVFISYHHEDCAWAVRLDEALRGAGRTTWWDTSLLAGVHFNDAIGEQLEAARCVLVIWSERSAKSVWVNPEAVSGFERNILIIGRIDDAALKFPFNVVQTVDLQSPDGVTRILMGVRAKLEGRPGPPQPSPEGDIRPAEAASDPSPPAHADSQKTVPAHADDRKTVFVSYPKDIAPPLMKRLVSTLIDRGFHVWLYDPSLYGFSQEELEKMRWQRGGEDFFQQTLDAARAADAMLFLISPWTLQSPFQKNELAIALERHRFVPCIVDKELDVKQLPPELSRLHAMRITEDMAEDEVGTARMQMLVRDLAEAAKRRPETAAASIKTLLSRFLGLGRR
jgi:hypothetical protein